MCTRESIHLITSRKWPIFLWPKCDHQKANHDCWNATFYWRAGKNRLFLRSEHRIITLFAEYSTSSSWLDIFARLRINFLCLVGIHLCHLPFPMSIPLVHPLLNSSLLCRPSMQLWYVLTKMLKRVVKICVACILSSMQQWGQTSIYDVTGQFP